MVINGKDVWLRIREKTLAAVNIAIKPEARLELLCRAVLLPSSK